MNLNNLKSTTTRIFMECIVHVCIAILVLAWWNTKVFQDKGQPGCAFSYIGLLGSKDGFIPLEQHLISECMLYVFLERPLIPATICILLYLVLNSTGLLCMWQTVYASLHAKGLKTFRSLSLRSDSQETLWIFTFPCKHASFAGGGVHGVTCGQVLFDFLAATFIFRIWRRLRLRRLVATVTNLPCCEADRGPPLPHTKGALQFSQHSRGLTSRLGPSEQLGSSSELPNVSTPGFESWQTFFMF